MNSAIQLGRELGGYAWVFLSWPFGYQTKSKQTEKSVHNDSRTSYTTTHAQRFRLVVSASTEKLQLARRKWDKLNLKKLVHPVCCWSKGNERTTWVPFDDLSCETLSLASPSQGTALPQAGFQVRNHSSIRTEDGGETYRLPSFPTWQGLAFLNDKRFIV